MKIGIDASRAFLKQRTGTEEYSFQVIKHLRDKLDDHQVVLYVKKGQEPSFELPKSWLVREIGYRRLWTHVGLSLELLFHPVDVLFIPSHTVPFIHPKKTIVTIHGLEYEFLPGSYHFWEKMRMRLFTKLSCRWASKIIPVSRNTRDDLMRLYGAPEKKMQVIYEGISDDNFKFEVLNLKSNLNDKISNYKPFLLFIGRLEKRKNVEGIVEAFKILKEKYEIPHKLILAGKPGFGYEQLKLKIENLFKNPDQKLQIVELGYIDEPTKRQLLANAQVFLFPSFYEGFGLPILEAQSSGVPVVASNVSSLPEVAGDGALYVDPRSPEFIAEAVFKLTSDQKFSDVIIEKGRENTERFSWDKCADSIFQLLNG